jgi:XTP/dITP diphosphohydrolase
MPQKLEGKLVVATHNPGKCAELRELLAPFGVGSISAADLGLSEPEETGASFRDNAILKARVAAEGANMPALADDSGLCVDALAGAPGIHSARWAGEARDFAAAMKRVEREVLAANPEAPPKAILLASWLSLFQTAR